MRPCSKRGRESVRLDDEGESRKEMWKDEAHLGLRKTEEGIDEAETAHSCPEPSRLCAPVESVGVEELVEEERGESASITGEMSEITSNIPEA